MLAVDPPISLAAPESPVRRVSTYLNVNGSRVYPEMIEAAIRTFPGVLDTAVTAIGSSRSRRLAAYLVLRPGLERVDIEGPLNEYLRDSAGLKVWQRPRVYAQVKRVPRHPETGDILRHSLNVGFDDGRRFCPKVVRWKPGQHQRMLTTVLARPANEVRFEGVLAIPPRKVERTIQLTVSHRLPNGRAKYVTFVVQPGSPLARRAAALTTGQHVLLVGEFGHKRSISAVDLVVIPAGKGEPVTLSNTNRMVAAVLS